MRADVLGPAAHVFLFEATHSFADGSFDFPLCFHGDLGVFPSPAGESRTQFPQQSVPVRIVGALGTLHLLQWGENNLLAIYTARGIIIEAGNLCMLAGESSIKSNMMSSDD
jgi:hypothetical protein